MEGFAFRAYIPALNGDVLRANLIKSTKRLEPFPGLFVESET